jgi:hypothetical protein
MEIGNSKFEDRNARMEIRNWKMELEIGEWAVCGLPGYGLAKFKDGKGRCA